MEINNLEIKNFNISRKHDLIWKLNDLSSQIKSLSETKKLGKDKMESIGLGTQKIDSLIKYQELKFLFLYKMIGLSEEEFDSTVAKLKEDMCDWKEKDELCCEKHFLTWSKLLLIEDYGSN